MIALQREEADALQNNELARQGRIVRKIDKAIAFRDSLLVQFNGHVESHGCQLPAVET